MRLACDTKGVIHYLCPMTRRSVAAAVCTLLLLTGAGCSAPSAPSSTADANSVPTASAETPPANTVPTGGMKMEPKTPPTLTDAQNDELAAGENDHAPTALTFDLNGGMFYFVPNVIHVKKGDTVTINFTNDGGFHDFTLDAFNVKIGPTQTGETKSATFVADKAGTFEYYCSVGSHRQLGQKGTLIVEE